MFLEFNIPRMGRRIDAVLLIGPVVFVIEFKVGESTFDRAAVDQAWDYALDLKNFHEASHSVSIVPILIATETTPAAPSKLHTDEDKVYHPILVHPEGFREAIDLTLQTLSGEVLDESDGRALRIIRHPPSWKPRGPFILNTRSMLLRATMRGHRICVSLQPALKNWWKRREPKGTNLFVSLQVCPEPAKLLSD